MVLNFKLQKKIIELKWTHWNKKNKQKKNAIKHFALYNNTEEWGKNSGTSTEEKFWSIIQLTKTNVLETT